MGIIHPFSNVGGNAGAGVGDVGVGAISPACSVTRPSVVHMMIFFITRVIPFDDGLNEAHARPKMCD